MTISLQITLGTAIAIFGISGDYDFILTAIDGQIIGAGVDKFRIKIQGPNGVIYDNKLGAPDSGNDAKELGGDSIVIPK